MGNLILNTVVDIANDFITGILNLVGNFVDYMFVVTLEAGEITYITDLCKLSAGLSLSLLGVAGVKRILAVYVFQTQGDPDEDPIELLYRIAMAVALIGTNSWIYLELKNFFFALAEDIKGMSGSTGISENIISAISFEKIELDGMVLAFLILIFFLVLSLIIFSLVGAIRAAQITFYRVILPIFTVDLISNEHKAWDAFLKDYLMQYATYCIQLICFQMIAACIAHMSMGAILYLLMAFAWVYIGIAGPEAVKKNLQPTGLAASAGRAAYIVTAVLK